MLVDYSSDEEIIETPPKPTLSKQAKMPQSNLSSSNAQTGQILPISIKANLTSHNSISKIVEENT